jgi:hypothetical protein
VMAKLGTELEERNLAFLASSVQLLSVWRVKKQQGISSCL